MGIIVTERIELCIEVEAETLEEATEKANNIPRDQWLGSYYALVGKTQEEFQEVNIDCFGGTRTLEQVIALTADDVVRAIKENKPDCRAGK